MSASLQSCHKGALTPTCFNLTWAQTSCIETHEFCIHWLEMFLIAVTSSELRQVTNLWSRSCASTAWTLEKGTKRLWGENCCYCLILAFSRAPGMESLVFIAWLSAGICWNGWKRPNLLYNIYIYVCVSNVLKNKICTYEHTMFNVMTVVCIGM
jgi:hypothetical protein